MHETAVLIWFLRVGAIWLEAIFFFWRGATWPVIFEGRKKTEATGGETPCGFFYSRVAIEEVFYMIIVMKQGCKKKSVEAVIKEVEKLGFRAHAIFGVERTVIGAVGDDRDKHVLGVLEANPCVEKLVPILQPYKLASREIKKEPTVVTVGGARFGGGHFGVIAGPCSVESEGQIVETAIKVKRAGARMLRGGAFKPRTSPYAFQGLEAKGLRFLAKARQESGLPIVTEVVNPEDVELVGEYADMLQVGARNVQNFSLLRKVGKFGKPILLKRGMSTTIQEFLMSAEYVLSEGCREVVLCERGIRTFENATRNTLDISAVPVVHERSHLPIIVDPSHAEPRRLFKPDEKAKGTFEVQRQEAVTASSPGGGLPPYTNFSIAAGRFCFFQGSYVCNDILHLGRLRIDGLASGRIDDAGIDRLLKTPLCLSAYVKYLPVRGLLKAPAVGMAATACPDPIRKLGIVEKGLSLRRIAGGHGRGKHCRCKCDRQQKNFSVVHCLSPSASPVITEVYRVRCGDAMTSSAAAEGRGHGCSPLNRTALEAACSSPPCAGARHAGCGSAA
jgi:3-deoxy-7-phosphoheptulonate synthase